MSSDPTQPEQTAPVAQQPDSVTTAAAPAPADDQATAPEPPAVSTGDTGPLAPQARAGETGPLALEEPANTPATGPLAQAEAAATDDTGPLTLAETESDTGPLAQEYSTSAAGADSEHAEPPSAATPTGPAWWEESTPFVEDGRTAPAPAAVAVPPVAPQAAPAAAPQAAPEPEQALAEPTPTAAPPPPAVEEPALPDGTRQLTDADAPAIAALRSRQGLAAAALRDIGRVRSANQDSVYALVTTLPRESSDLSMGLFVVADGMGGHDGGEVASRLAVGVVARQVLADLVMPALADGQTEALQPLVVSAVQEANRAIWEHARAIGSDMGTTCTTALLMGSALYIGHVGDSRAYLRTPLGLRAITNDHSAVGRLIQLGQLDPAEAREHPLRSHLYRTVGQQPEVLVDFIYQPIGDATHLLLCSDGLWGLLDEAVILDVLEHTIWPQDACRELIALANLAGGEDNISAVVVTLPTQG